MKTLIIKLKVLTLLILSTNLFFPVGSYAHFGSKGPFGGSVSCGIMNGTTVYLGTSEGGVFESTTAALTAWRARPVGLKSGKITALAHTDSYLFAGTADSGIFIFNGYSGSDRYWIKVNTGLSNLKIKSLVAIDTITVLAGTDGGGIFKTINKGQTWTHISNTDLNTAVITAFAKAGNRIIAASQNGGLFVSEDKGNTWNGFNDANTLSINGTNAISYNETTNELLVLNNNGLYIGSDILTTSSPSFISAQIVITPSTIHSISNNGTDWYLATATGVYTSTTALLNWNSANTGLQNDALNVSTVVPFQTSLIAGTTQYGVFKTEAASISWSANNFNFNNLVTHSMICQGEMLVIAATSKGVFVSRDIAANYVRANTGLNDSLNVNDLAMFGAKLLAATKNQGIYVSADTGRSWTQVNIGLTNLNIRKVVASSTYVYLIAADGTVYQSTLTGWASIQTGLPSGVVPTSFTFYNGNVLLGTLGNGIYTRPEASGSWMAANNGLSNMQVTSVTTNGVKLFAGTNGSGVVSSDINMIHWNAVSPLSVAHTTLVGLDGSKVQAMAYNEGYIYASYKGGLLASSDNGLTWIPGGNQFNLPSYTDVTKISFVTTRVFVTTENNALYSNALTELPMITTGITHPKNELSASSVVLSPNPSNGSFTVEVDAMVTSEISEIIILNSHGAVLDRFENYSKEIAVEYPKGIYYVQVRTTRGNTTKKMIVE